jgi:hypothetical protein
VHAFALPALQKTARTFEAGRTLSHQSTDDARTLFAVNAPAAAQGVWLTSSASSGAPEVLMPALIAEALNPLAAVIPPVIDFKKARLSFLTVIGPPQP